MASESATLASPRHRLTVKSVTAIEPPASTSVRTLPVNFQPRAVRYSPDGRYLAVAGANVVLYELTSDR